MCTDNVITARLDKLTKQVEELQSTKSSREECDPIYGFLILLFSIVLLFLLLCGTMYYLFPSSQDNQASDIIKAMVANPEVVKQMAKGDQLHVRVRTL
jgi:hypothetical protein